MELAIPLVALGGMYIISNQSNKSNESKQQSNNSNNAKENFTNMGKTKNYLPNTNVPPQNYPIMNNTELNDTVQEYPNPNVATDKYFDQNLYEKKERNNIDIHSNIQQIYSLTGDYMSSNQFRHNNMVPFTGSKPKGEIYNNNNQETLLDNYVGAGSQIIKKIEQAPLFKPQENMQWAYGAPNMSDFYQSRVNPALKNNIVKPFESIRVGPGLDKGYEAEGSGGYNSGMEARDYWLPKTVDELRVSTNPKEEFSLMDHEGPASSQIKNVGILGKVEKYTPDTFFINTQDRWLTTTGAEKANRNISQEVLKTSHRNETTTHFTGTPNATLKTASYVPIKYEQTKRIQLDACNVGHSNAVGTGPSDDANNFLKSHTNYTNNRSLNVQPPMFGAFSGAIGAVIAPIMDILKPIKKEEYTCNMRIYGNINGEVPGNYVLTPNDVPNSTIKESTLYEPNGYIGNQIDGGYQVSDQQAIYNQRDSTNISQMGAMGGAGNKVGQMQYDYMYRQTNNESKEKSIVGRTNQGNSALFNSQMNISIDKLDGDRDNNRLWAPSAVIPAGPSVQTYGKMQMPAYTDQCQGCERINPDILKAIKDNPYVHSFTNIP
jgi:hypothetical protein